jgi:hemerythrin-like metal-binding protein
MSDLFLWSERYSVGVQQFDADHRRLLELAHQMVTVTLRGPLPADPGDVLNELIICAEEHFGHEEHLLRATDYPRLHEHRREHQRLLEEIQDHKAAFADGKVSADDVARFVADWIFVHIDQEDRKYRAHLNERGYR